MPEGAYSEDLSNSSRLGQFIATHAEDWYKFVNGPRGLEVLNGDLRVVIGCDKTTSWGMATFSNSILTKFRLKFSALGEQQSQHNDGNKYGWEHSDVTSADVKIGPGRRENEDLGETDSNRLRNQSLFLRTLNVTLSENAWKEIFPHLVPVADQNPHSGLQNQPTCGPHAVSSGHLHPQPSRSNSHQNLPSGSRNSSLSDLVSPVLMSPSDSRPSTDSSTNMFLQVENISKMNCVPIDEEIQCNDSTPTPDVTQQPGILTHSLSCNVSIWTGILLSIMLHV